MTTNTQKNTQKHMTSAFTNQTTPPSMYTSKAASPPNVTKNIPVTCNQRISSNSLDRKLFEETKGPFQDALNKGSYDYELSFEEPNTKSGGKQCRKRKTIYFNPPWSKVKGRSPVS